jgi:isoquinoline 1-oxidoreductase subunit beta
MAHARADEAAPTSSSRRDFLKGSATVGGGLMLGLTLPGLLPAAAAPAEGAVHAPNAWVHISDGNVITLLCARSEMGQGVYTALPMLIAEELNVDLNQVTVAFAPAAAVYANAALGAQITGGSTSVRDGWEKLRIAGAQVREMLISAAAARWQVDRASLKAVRGVVSGGGKRATYGALAAAAARLPVPDNVVLKDPSKFRLVGKPTRRLDTPSKVNGSAEFGIDVKLPHMAYASIEQCPVIGGKVRSFDGDAAGRMRGVIDVVSIGDGVAVVADSYWHAKQAREHLTVMWDEGPGASLNSASMLQGIREAAGTDTPIAIRKPVGNVAEAMKIAARQVSAEYTLPLQAHAPLEPQNFTASFKDGKCLLIGPTQFQTGAVGAVATALGIKPEAITLNTTFIGGGFGRRLELDFIVQAALVSKAVGRPVKVLWTREDDFKHDFYRPLALNQLQAGLDAAGMPIALAFKVTSQSVTQRAFGLPKNTLDPFMAEAAVAPYSIPNTTHDLVIHDSGLRVGYWRSVSHNMNAFANESFMDEMAAAAGKDPLQYRLALLADKPRFMTVLQLAADKAGWGTALPAGSARGVALMEGYDTYMAQVAQVSVDKGAVKLERVVIVADLGRMINPDTVMAQIQSSVIFGMSAALLHQVTVKNGRVEQSNFDDFPVARMNQVPQIDIVLVPSTEKPGGIGEPATALIGPAIANAVFAATGKRVRTLPITVAAMNQV